MPQIVPCKQCGIRTPYTDLKPNLRGVWICTNCMRKEQKASPAVAKAQPQAILTGKPIIKQEKEPANDFRYKCEGCNYDVQSNRDLFNKMCPYCGQKGTLKPKKTSSDIIREVSDWT